MDLAQSGQGNENGGLGKFSFLETLDDAGLPDFSEMRASQSNESFGINNFENHENIRSNGNFSNFSNNDFHADNFELQQLFSKISDFQPSELEIMPHYKPFLPELKAAIGEIDAFIKIPRPDDDVDELGLTVLDEPSIGQMDPIILKMELREKFGHNTPMNEMIGELKHKDLESPKALNSFMESIEEIHRNRPPPSMKYTYKMPELEELMEMWPDEIEEMLKSVPIPGADLDLSVEEYVRVICAILDIPVKRNIIESLHHLFALFAQFEGNQYFQSQNVGMYNDNSDKYNADDLH